MTRQKVIAVVTSGDATGINFTRSLRLCGGFKIVGIDTSVEDYHTSEADERFLLPPATTGEFLSALKRLCDETNPDLVYAADTNPELMLVFKHRDGLPLTFLPNLEDAVAEDKWKTWLRLKDAGIPVHRNRLIQGIGDLSDFMSETRPIWLRRRQGSGGSGSIATGDQDVANAWITHHDGWGHFIAAELLSKRTATWIGIWWDGQLQACQLRERCGWKYQALSASGVTGITAVQKTFWDPALHDLAERCVLAVCGTPHGILSVDFTWDEKGEPRPTEIQPSRFYSSVHFLSCAGFNIVETYCRIALEGPLAIPLINPIRDEIYWVKSIDTPGKLLTREEWEAARLYG